MFKAAREFKARMQIGSFLEQSKNFLLQSRIYLTAEDWDDPYLYGYHNGSTLGVMIAGSSKRLPGESITKTQAWGWNELTGLPEPLYISRSLEFMDARDSDWQLGYDNGMLWAALVSGTADVTIPIVRETIEHGRTLANQARAAGHHTPFNDLQDGAAFAYQRDWFAYILQKKRVENVV